MSIKEALIITVFSMGLVFVLLAVIASLVKLQTFILAKISKGEKHNSIKNQEDNIIEENDTNYDDEKEIVAAIMASISAYTNVPQDKLQIKSIRRVSNSWRKTSIRDSFQRR